MAEKPKLEIARDPEVIAAPDPFNVAALRLGQNFEEATGARKLITTVPVRKPHRQEWFRVHPAENYRANFGVINLKEDGEFYLVTPDMVRQLGDETFPATIYTAINQQRVVFLWPARLPTQDNQRRTARWYTSAHEIAEIAMKQSVRMKANMSLGAYEPTISDNPNPEPDPIWPDISFNELLRIGFQKTGCLVDGFNHPVIKLLRGS